MPSCFSIIGRKARKETEKSTSEIPDLNDHESVQRFFLQEVKYFTFIVMLYLYSCILNFL